MILGGMPQDREVHLISLNQSDPVPQCIPKLPDHPQVMEWSAFAAGGLGEWPCSDYAFLTIL